MSSSLPGIPIKNFSYSQQECSDITVSTNIWSADLLAPNSLPFLPQRRPELPQQEQKENRLRRNWDIVTGFYSISPQFKSSTLLRSPY